MQLIILITKHIRRLVKFIEGSLWDIKNPLEDYLLGLDIGCGRNKRNRFIGIDKIYNKNIDLVCDIEQGYLPFKDNVFDIVYSNHVLEHLKNLDFVLSEITRVMKVCAEFQVSVPYAGSFTAFQDPTHVRFFTINTFDYFVQKSDFDVAHTKKYFYKIIKRSFVFRRGPICLLLSIVINRSLFLQRYYERSFLRVNYNRLKAVA